MNLTKNDFFDNITPENIKAYSEINIKNVKKTICDLHFDSKKILICEYQYGIPIN